MGPEIVHDLLPVHAVAGTKARRFTKVAAFLSRQAPLAMFSEPTLTQKAPNSHKRAASAPCARDAWCSGLEGRRILDSLRKHSFLVPSPIFLRIRAYANGSPVCSWASQAAWLRRPKRVEGLLEHMLPSRSGRSPVRAHFLLWALENLSG